MANYATLKAAIAAVIKQNGNNEITGQLLQQQLLSIVNTLGQGYQFAGVATPATNPGMPDGKVWYLAPAGSYPNFGATAAATFVVPAGSFGVFAWSDTWTRQTIEVASVIPDVITYAECTTPAATVAKVVAADNFRLVPGVQFRVKFSQANTAANPTLNIGGTGALPIVYDGEAASATNSWEAGEVVLVYYDGTSWCGDVADTTGNIDVDDTITYNNAQLQQFIRQNIASYGDGRVVEDTRFDSLFLPINAGNRVIMRGLSNVSVIDVKLYNGEPGVSTFVSFVQCQVSGGVADVVIPGTASVLSVWVRANYASASYNITDTVSIDVVTESVSLYVDSKKIVEKELSRSDALLPTSGAVNRALTKVVTTSEGAYQRIITGVDKREITTSNFVWNGEGQKEQIGNVQYISSEQMMIPAGIEFLKTDALFNGGAANLRFWDASGVCIGMGTGTTPVDGWSACTIPSDAAFVAFVISSTGGSLQNYNVDFYAKYSLADLYGECGEKELMNVRYGVNAGHWNANTGALEGRRDGRHSTTLIDVKDVTTLQVSVHNNTDFNYVYCWSQDYRYLGRIGRSATADGYDTYDLTRLNGVRWFAVNYGLEAAPTIRYEGYPTKLFYPISEDGAAEARLSDFYNASQSDQQMLDQLIDFLSHFPRKVIHIDRDVTISKPIRLGSNTTLYIENAKIKQADEMYDFAIQSDNFEMTGYTNGDMPTDMADVPLVENIKVIGIGKAYIEGPTIVAKINGNEAIGDLAGLKAMTMYFVHTHNVLVDNVTLCLNRCWSLEFELCHNVIVRNCDFYALATNGDGIDFRVGCKKSLVHNCRFWTQDDPIACTALGTSERPVTDRGEEGTWKMWPALLAEDPEALYIDNITLSDCVTCRTVSYEILPAVGRGIGICLSAYGSKVQNVSWDRCRELADGYKVAEGILIFHGYGSGYNAGDINNIRINDCATYDNYVVKVGQGTEVITDVWINKSTNLTTPANVALVNAASTVTITNS